jgi:hypothetical protein
MTSGDRHARISTASTPGLSPEAASEWLCIRGGEMTRDDDMRALDGIDRVGRGKRARSPAELDRMAGNRQKRPFADAVTQGLAGLRVLVGRRVVVPNGRFPWLVSPVLVLASVRAPYSTRRGARGHDEACREPRARAARPAGSTRRRCGAGGAGGVAAPSSHPSSCRGLSGSQRALPGSRRTKPRRLQGRLVQSPLRLAESFQARGGPGPGRIGKTGRHSLPVRRWGGGSFFRGAACPPDRAWRPFREGPFSEFEAGPKLRIGRSERN